MDLLFTDYYRNYIDAMPSDITHYILNENTAGLSYNRNISPINYGAYVN